MSFAFAEEAIVETAEQVTEAANTVAKGRLDLRGFGHVGDSFIDALLGYGVVFIGLTLLMLVIIIVGRVMVAKSRKEDSKSAAPAEAPVAAAPAVPRKLAPGSAGDVKLYDTDPRDAAMIMAIVADKTGKPLNELRFRSIKEVK